MSKLLLKTAAVTIATAAFLAPAGPALAGATVACEESPGLECGTGSNTTDADGTAVGIGANASGSDGATAVGQNAQATSVQTTALGEDATATGGGALALGNRSMVCERGASFGYNNLVSDMVVLGIALEVTGLAGAFTGSLIASLDGLSPLVALIIIYGATLFATELLSNATVAVLFTPIAVSLAEALAVSPRPFLVAVMIAGSAAFATPFGYQTNVLVYQMGSYNYLDFVRIGIPLNLLTWIAGVTAISFYFPF